MTTHCYASPEQDPAVLIVSCQRALQELLRLHPSQPLRRSGSDWPYGEEEITRLEEEVLPALEQYLTRLRELEASRGSAPLRPGHCWRG